MTKASRWIPLLLSVVVASVLGACGDDGGGSPLVPPTGSAAPSTAAPGGGGSGSVTTAAPVTTVSPETTMAPVALTCDEPAVPVVIGETVTAMLVTVDAPYPANARYYCFSVGQDVGRVTIDLSGATTDLDLYVGFGTIASVQGIDLTAGDSYEWLSNDFGVVDEQVVITGPDPGVYYIEIVPYEGESSPYTLQITG